MSLSSDTEVYELFPFKVWTALFFFSFLVDWETQLTTQQFEQLKRQLYWKLFFLVAVIVLKRQFGLTSFQFIQKCHILI